MGSSARVMGMSMEWMTMRGCTPATATATASASASASASAKAGGRGLEGSGLRRNARVWEFVHVIGWVRWPRPSWPRRRWKSWSWTTNAAR